MEVVGGIIVIIALVMMWAITANQSKKLADPSNRMVVHLGELTEQVALAQNGAFVLTMYRQSGNPYADRTVFQTPSAALAAATSTFRRAQIDAVEVSVNTADRLNVTRAFHSSRGRAEGKKVGSFEIIRVAD